MAFEGLKDQLKDKWSELSAEVQDSPLFNTLKEKYQELPPLGQKGVFYGSIFLLLFLFFSLPQSLFFDPASSLLEEFDTNRKLSQGLLRAGRTGQTASAVPPGPSFEELRPQVSGLIQNMGLLPEQIGETSSLAENPAGNLLPAVLRQVGLQVQLKKLNLKQIVDIGYRLQGLHPSVKLMGLDISTAPSETHYYNVSFKLVSFIPPSAPGEG